jgi:hypothetical protein
MVIMNKMWGRESLTIPPLVSVTSAACANQSHLDDAAPAVLELIDAAEVRINSSHPCLACGLG